MDEASDKAAVGRAGHAGPAEVTVAKVGRLAGDEAVGHRPRTGVDFAEGEAIEEEAEVLWIPPRPTRWGPRRFHA